MNGGAPGGPRAGGGRAAERTASPLRALRLAPALVDDLGAVPRLTAAAGLSVPDPAEAAELVRWTRAWLVVWQGALHAAGVIGGAAPGAVPLPLGAVPTLKGDPEHRRRDAALALLERAGLLVRHRESVDAAAREPDARGDQFALSDTLFVAHRAGLEVDWAHACWLAGREPAALLVLRALTDLVSPLDALTPVSLRELAARTGYGEKQVRVALRRLGEAGVLRASEAPGQPARYRLGDAVLGRVAEPSVAVSDRGPGPAPAGRGAAPAATPRDRPVPASSASPAPAPAVRLTLNGVTLSLGAGVTAHVEYDADGVPHLTIPPATRP